MSDAGLPPLPLAAYNLWCARRDRGRIDATRNSKACRRLTTAVDRLLVPEPRLDFFNRQLDDLRFL